MSKGRRIFLKPTVAFVAVVALSLLIPAGAGSEPNTGTDSTIVLPSPDDTPESNTAPASFETAEGLSYMERRIRSAAVKVLTPRGHGSGSYMLMDGFRVILTAQHVASGPIGEVYRVSSPSGNETVGARLVYSNPASDVAVLIVSEMKTRSPMQFRLRNDRIPLGTDVAYAGHPSSHSLLSFRGRVSGYENEGVEPSETRRGEILILHSFGWPGCSGSVLFDSDGYIVGVLWGVSAGNITGAPQLIEDLIWATPARSIIKSDIITSICRMSPRPERCRRFSQE